MRATALSARLGRKPRRVPSSRHQPAALRRLRIRCSSAEAQLAVAGCALGGLLAWRIGIPSAAIVRNAVCSSNTSIDCNSGGLGGITNAASQLIGPILVAMIAICPIACLVGAAAVMFGNRKGLVIIGSALGALIFAGAIKGIVA